MQLDMLNPGKLEKEMKVSSLMTFEIRGSLSF
jgi:hypothetical protein